MLKYLKENLNANLFYILLYKRQVLNNFVNLIHLFNIKFKKNKNISINQDNI